MDPTARDGYREAWVTLFLARMSPGDKEACSRRKNRCYTIEINVNSWLRSRSLDYQRKPTDEYTRLSLNIFDLSIAITYSNIRAYARRRRRRRRKEKMKARKYLIVPNYLHWTLSNFRNSRIVSAIEVTANLRFSLEPQLRGKIIINGGE